VAIDDLDALRVILGPSIKYVMIEGEGVQEGVTSHC